MLKWIKDKAFSKNKKVLPSIAARGFTLNAKTITATTTQDSFLQASKSLIFSIPKKTLAHILSFTTPNDLLSFRQVNKQGGRFIYNLEIINNNDTDFRLSLLDFLAETGIHILIALRQATEQPKF